MKRVFVSYSRSNAEVVAQLIKDLNAAGVNTWHDQTLTGASAGGTTSYPTFANVMRSYSHYRPNRGSPRPVKVSSATFID